MALKIFQKLFKKKSKGHIVLTPEEAYAPLTQESEENCAIMAVKELKDYLENGNITNSVNLPSVVEPRTTSHRICIIHKNVPNMLGQLTSVLGTNHINIENLVNKARNDVAYTMIDTNSEADVAALKAIENVIRVRIV